MRDVRRPKQWADSLSSVDNRAHRLCISLLAIRITIR
jgi:hypothetical protein